MIAVDMPSTVRRARSRFVAVIGPRSSVGAAPITTWMAITPSAGGLTIRVAARQTVLNREQRRLGAVGHAELGQQVPDVGLDRLLGDAELQRDPLVGVPERDQLQDLALATGQVLDAVAARRRALSRELNVCSSRAATVGSMSASSAQALRTARASSAGSTSLSR